MVIEAVNLKIVIANKERAVKNLIFQSTLKLFKTSVQRNPKTSKQDNFFITLGQPKTLSDLIGKNKQKNSIFVWQRGLAVLWMNATAGKEAIF